MPCAKCQHLNPVDVDYCFNCAVELDHLPQQPRPLDGREPVTHDLMAALTEETFPLNDRYAFRRHLPARRQGAGLALCRSRETDQLVVVRLGNVDQPKVDEEVAGLLQAAPDARYVVPIVETGSNGPLWYEVHEHIEQFEAYENVELRSLADLLEHEGSALPGPLVDQVLDHLITCLEYIHGEGLVHGGLQPSDILVKQREPLQLVLTDFRRGAVLERTNKERPRLAAYAPPERELSVATDWWSLGIVLLELLVGEHPFQLSDGGLAADQIINDYLATRAVPIRESINERWQRLFRHLLERIPDDRWQAPRVQAWQSHQDPVLVVEEPLPAMIWRTRFPFGNDSYVALDTLAAAMAGRWDEVGQLITSAPAIDELADWLGQFELSPRLCQILESCQNHAKNKLRLDRLIATLITEMAPTLPPSFRGFPVDRESLIELARRAVGGSEDERDAIHHLRDSRSLRVYSGLPGCTGYAKFDAQWQKNIPAVFSWASFSSELRDMLAAGGEAEVESSLLLALVDRSALRELEEDVEAVDMKFARARPWFAKFVDEQLVHEELNADLWPAYLWVLTRVAPLAEQQRADEIEKQRVLEQARLEAARIAAETRRAAEKAARLADKAKREAEETAAANAAAAAEAAEKVEREKAEQLALLKWHQGSEKWADNLLNRKGLAVRYEIAVEIERIATASSVLVLSNYPSPLAELPHVKSLAKQAVMLEPLIPVAAARLDDIAAFCTTTAEHLRDRAEKIDADFEAMLSRPHSPAPEKPLPPSPPHRDRKAIIWMLVSLAIGVFAVIMQRSAGLRGIRAAIFDSIVWPLGATAFIAFLVQAALWLESGAKVQKKHVEALHQFEVDIDKFRYLQLNYLKAEKNRQAGLRDAEAFAIQDLARADVLDVIAQQCQQPSTDLRDDVLVADLRNLIDRIRSGPSSSAV